MYKPLYKSQWQYCSPNPNVVVSNEKFFVNQITEDFVNMIKKVNKKSKKIVEKYVGDSSAYERINHFKCENELEKGSKEYWGHVGWDFLHACTFGYSPVPTEDEKKAATNFFSSLPYMLPCEVCSKHCYNYIKDNPPNVKDTDTLSRWLVDFHNKVNIRLGKPTKQYADVAKDFATNSVCEV